MKNTFKILIASVMLAFGSVASAVTVAPPVFEFDGDGSFGSGLFTNDDGSISGVGININSIFVTTGEGIRTEYNVDNGSLDFNTGTSSLAITGSVDSVFGTGYNVINIFGGDISGTLDSSTGFTVFTGTGSGGVNSNILTTLGVANGTYDYFAFTLGVDGYGVITTDITATLDGGRDISPPPPAVPIPAAAWLFGSGLLGLVAVGRRKDTV